MRCMYGDFWVASPQSGESGQEKKKKTFCTVSIFHCTVWSLIFIIKGRIIITASLFYAVANPARLVCLWWASRGNNVQHLREHRFTTWVHQSLCLSVCVWVVCIQVDVRLSPHVEGGGGGFNWAWLVSKTQTYESIPFVRLAVYGHARCNRRRTTQHYDVYKQPMQQSEHRLAPNVCMTLKAGWDVIKFCARR